MRSYKGFAIIAALGAVLMAGCASTPGPASSEDVVLELAVQSATIVAVDRVVSRDGASADKRAERATRIVNVASALKALGTDKLSTLPLIKSALTPLLDDLNLSTLERQQADLLVSALVTVALERTDVDQYVARVSLVLDQVIASASAYLPPAPEPTTL